MTRLCVLDTETTGLDTAVAQFVEIAALVFNNDDPGEMVTMFEELANPGVPIPPEAKATHHIQERDLINARPPADVLLSMFQAMTPTSSVDYWVAHNAPYDRGILALVNSAFMQYKWIDTVQCSKHLWPEAPGHSNQVLRYWLELDVDHMLPAGLYPHRALYDVIVTTAILRKMLESKTPEELYDLSTKPALLYKCNFPKHKGVLWKNVPKDYLQWAVKAPDMDPNVRHTAMYYLSTQTSLL